MFEKFEKWKAQLEFNADTIKTLKSQNGINEANSGLIKILCKRIDALEKLTRAERAKP